MSWNDISTWIGAPIQESVLYSGSTTLQLWRIINVSAHCLISSCGDGTNAHAYNVYTRDAQ